MKLLVPICKLHSEAGNLIFLKKYFVGEYNLGEIKGLIISTEHLR